MNDFSQLTFLTTHFRFSFPDSNLPLSSTFLSAPDTVPRSNTRGNSIIILPVVWEDRSLHYDKSGSRSGLWSDISIRRTQANFIGRQRMFACNADNVSGHHQP